MDVNVDTAPEIEDNSCFLDVELEALQSIYINETEVHKDEEFTIVSIDLHPATADKLDEQYVKMTLKLSIQEGYPEVLPEINIRNPRGLSDEKLNSIIQDLIKIAENKKGHSMLFEIIEAAKDHLTAGNRPCEECAICLYGFHNDDIFTKTECYHYFHSHCLDRYCKNAVTNKDDSDSEEAELLCPVCRLPISFNELETDFPPPVHGDVQFEVTDDVLEMQKKMNELYLQQVEKGGIIDLEAEKNKYLLEISNVPTLTDSNPDVSLEKSENDGSLLEVEEDEHDKSNSSAEQNSQNDSENISLADNKTIGDPIDCDEKVEYKNRQERTHNNARTDRYNKPKRYDRDHNERYDSRRGKPDDRRNFQSGDFRRNTGYDSDRRREKFYDYDRRNNVYDRDRKNFGFGNDRDRKSYGYGNDRDRKNYGYGNERRNFKYDNNRRSNRYDYDQRNSKYDKGQNNDKIDDHLEDLASENRRDKFDNSSNEAEVVKNNIAGNESEDKIDSYKSERHDSDGEHYDRQHSKTNESPRYNRYDNRGSGRYNSQRNFRHDDRRNFRFNDNRKYSYRENRMNNFTSDRNYKDRDSRRNEQQNYDVRKVDKEESSSQPETEQVDGASWGENEGSTGVRNWGEAEPATDVGNWGSTEPAPDVSNWGSTEPATNVTNWDSAEPATDIGSWDLAESSIETGDNAADQSKKTERTDFSPNRKKFPNRNSNSYNRAGYPNQRYNNRYSNDRKFNGPRYSNYRSQENYSKAQSRDNENFQEPEDNESGVQREGGYKFNKTNTRQVRSDLNYRNSENDYNPQTDKKDFRKNNPVNKDGDSPRYKTNNYRNNQDENGRGGSRYRQNYKDTHSARNLPQDKHSQSDYPKVNSRTSTNNYNKNFCQLKEDNNQNSDRGQESSSLKAASDAKTKESVVQKSSSCDESISSSTNQASQKPSCSVNNSVPTSNFLPPMSSSIAPPPGFQNPSRKIVYGLAAANPPPGFNRS